MSTDRAQIGATVKAARLRRRLSMDAAAAEAGLSHMTWRRIERGLGVQDRSLAAALTFVGVPVDAITAGVEVREETTEERSTLAAFVRASARAGVMRVLSGFPGVAS